MPTFVPSPWVKVLQLYQHDAGGDRLSTTYGIQVSGGTTEANITTAVSEADSDFRNQWRQLTDTNVQMLPAVGYYLQSGSGEDPATDVYGIVTSTVAAQPGLLASTSPPPNTCAVIRKRTGSIGRTYRGRCYIPYVLSEATMNELGVINGSSIIVLQSAADQWLALANGGDTYNGLWLLHEYRKEGVQIAPTRITSMGVSPVVGTQRRRIP